MINQQYKTMQSRWRMCRDAAAGEYEVHQARETYLPRLEQETDKAYDSRLAMTPWFGATWRTIIALRGMMFRRDPNLQAPDALLELTNNIDNSGTSLTSFSQKVAIEALTVGRCGLLVEYTKVEEGVTLAETDGIGARPYFCFYTAESILDWKCENVNGVKQLVMVRLMQKRDDYANDYELDDDEQVNLILELAEGKYQQRLVIVKDEEETDLKTITPQMGGAPLPYIPFQFIGVDSLDPDVQIPPLMDLITLNFHHYRQSSSYERGCFISGLPTLFVFGNSDSERIIYLGGATANSLPDTQARAEFLEVKSNFQALVSNLESKEKQMAVMGARMLEQQNKGVESAQTWQRKQSGEESVLADMATTISSGITNQLKVLADWAGIESDDISLDLNKEFLPFAMDAQMITALMGAYIQKGLSYDALFYNMDKAGMYPPGTTKEDEQGLLGEGEPGLVL